MTAIATDEVDERPVTTGHQTVVAMAERSRRTFVPLRSRFVQAERTDAETPRPGPLATFMRAGDRRAMVAYLLVLTAASSEPWDVRHASAVWARALGIDVERPTAAVSKVWKRLEDRRLIERTRIRRQVVLTPLREDGGGDAYTRPDGKAKADRYLKLDHSFWEDQWYERLSLPAIGVLLIALAEKPGFELPYDRGPMWYGISADSVYRGFKELADAGIITYTVRYRPEPLSETGYVEVRRWHLQDPFARRGERT